MTYYIINISPEGVKPLAQFSSEDEADDLFDYYCELYPHAALDIIPEGEIIFDD